MAAAKENKNSTTVVRKSASELAVTRLFNGPVDIVFKAWSTPELFQRWWAPKSFKVSIQSGEMDIRTGGSYRLLMRHPASDKPMAFFGRYLEVTPPSRMVWTNEESENGAVTTVTFEARGDQTLVVLTDTYPSKEALDEAMASGATSGFPEQFQQLDEILSA
jgi:uncharacterized protein YndB with AHSA1/START domain